MFETSTIKNIFSVVICVCNFYQVIGSYLGNLFCYLASLENRPGGSSRGTVAKSGDIRSFSFNFRLWSFVLCLLIYSSVPKTNC